MYVQLLWLTSKGNSAPKINFPLVKCCSYLELSGFIGNHRFVKALTMHIKNLWYENGHVHLQF